ncbi:GntR family transcriptional regulator [Streptomyces sp. NPDC058045]|uniref:GntR family transcriptional regulator n=1 Tax=Streptomyces sp. NPDC058045 TaxID=3346311 RepID=UPI0036E1B8F5
MTAEALHGEAFSSIALDRTSAIPLHEQIYQELRRMIVDHALAADQMLPREIDLAEALDVSRGTMRQAITRLANDGLLYRTSGRGTFVKAQRSDYPLTRLIGFTEQMMAEGRTPSSEVIGVTEIDEHRGPAGVTFPARVKRLLRIDRVRKTDEEPVALEELYLPYPRFAGLRDLDLNTVSVYAAIEDHFAVTLGGGQFQLDIGTLTSRHAALLHEDVNAPVFLMTGAVTDDRGDTVLAVSSRYRPAFVSFQLNLPRNGGGSRSASQVSLVHR